MNTINNHHKKVGGGEGKIKDRFEKWETREDLISLIEYFERLNANAWKEVSRLRLQLIRLKANIRMSLSLQETGGVNHTHLQDGDIGKLVECMENTKLQEDKRDVAKIRGMQADSIIIDEMKDTLTKRCDDA